MGSRSLIGITSSWLTLVKSPTTLAVALLRWTMNSSLHWLENHLHTEMRRSSSLSLRKSLLNSNGMVTLAKALLKPLKTLRDTLWSLSQKTLPLTEKEFRFERLDLKPD